MNEHRWEDLVIGLSAELQVRVDDEMMRRFFAITGDSNPLHQDPEHARAHGFDDRVVYGLLTASFYSTLAGVLLPGRRCLLHGVNVSFHKPVYVGDELHVRGEVVYRNEVFRQAELACTTTNQHGVKVAGGKLKVGVLDSERAPLEATGSTPSAALASGAAPPGRARP